MKNPKLTNPINYLAALIIVLALFQLFTFSSEKPDTKEADTPNIKNYQIKSLSPPKTMKFAGEKIPLKEPEVSERLDRELHANTYFHSNTILYFKRANRWFPLIEKILKANGIPEDFKYLALIESGLQNVISPAGATGYWQFLKETALEYGLTVNDEIDERYHIEKSTEAACKYLKDAYEKYESWSLVAAAYNVGMSRISSELDRQKTDNYYDLLLNLETRRYVFRIAAVKHILENPERYGFNIDQSDLYPPLEYKEIQLNSGIENFADFAHTYKISYKVLKYFNPWLRQAYLNNASGKIYQIKIPTNSAYHLHN